MGEYHFSGFFSAPLYLTDLMEKESQDYY